MNPKATLAKVFSLNVIIWMAMLTFFAGLMFCAVGVYMLLAERLGATQASLLTGGGLIAIVALALIVVLIASSSGGKKKKKASASKNATHEPDNMIEQQLRPVLGDRATNWAKQNTGLAVVGALSAGVILAASPRFRSLLIGAAGPLATRRIMQTFNDLTDSH
ncbi:hypothetical protein [Salinisphaera sp. T31B1]|uniref:hypothetical protein n=1 Tax=Salinisphaera sp. T31B1 TaxID=727963 RepID=UPI00333E5D36